MRMLATLALLGSCLAQAQVIPADSAIGRDASRTQVLLNPMEPGASIHQAAWRMSQTYVEAGEVEPKLGTGALTLGAHAAEVAGSKGDFTVAEWLPGRPTMLGMWVHLSPDANVKTIGFQVHDSEDESLIASVDADWTGWQWVEADITEGLEQTYPQDDKNGVVDYPVRSVHIAWFTEAPGETSLTVDALVALTEMDAEDKVNVRLAAPDEVEPGQPLDACVFATNLSENPIDLTLDYSLQANPGFHAEPLPHPVHGSDHAAGSKSWLEYDGEVVEDGASTDGKPWTSAGTSYQQDHYTEAFQLVDLGQVREITRMTWTSGDANHSWLVDVFASEDGESFTPVPGLVDVDHFKKWGTNDFPLQAPLKAKVIRFRYHTGGEKQPAIRFPSEIGIYDGTADEEIGIPRVGPAVGKGSVNLTVPARSFASAVLDIDEPISGGAYLLGVDAKGPRVRSLSTRHVFGALGEDASLLGADSRIALNASTPALAPELAKLGVGWVRFENMKWPMVSHEPHKYSFTGEVPPWRLNIDQIFHTYRDAGLGILSYMFLVPEWASRPSDDVPDKMRLAQPPKDPSDYGEFCFQVVARYGSKKHPDDALLTADRKSGLDLVKHFEMYNEPNLNPSLDAQWGGWAASTDQYYEMMRHGAEGVKRADPDAVVTSAGYAGMSAEMIDELRKCTYPDGRRALDFVEVLQVHYYSGHEPPETATTDGNAKVTGQFTFPENLRELAAWRDEHAPDMPIWMTETGYDSAGPFGTTEAIQAARLPRVVMLCLANGIDKTFVYRESGSTASQHAASGVLRNDFSRKPSWYTFGTLIRQLHGARGGATRLPHADPNVWLLEWDIAGQPIVTAWTVNGTGTLGLDLGKCIVTDAFGGESSLDSTNELSLSPYPRYISGLNVDSGLGDLRAEHQRQEAAKAVRRERIAGLRKHLYDFGTMDLIGTLAMEGRKMPFVPVLKASAWDEGIGYGFEPEPMGDDDRRWLAGDKLNRDSVRVRDHVFKFRVEPGEYTLRFNIEPFTDAAEVIVTGADDGPITINVPKKEPLTALDISITGASADVGIHVVDDYAHMYWITCVEKLD